jgi:hypothetical protein
VRGSVVIAIVWLSTEPMASVQQRVVQRETAVIETALVKVIRNSRFPDAVMSGNTNTSELPARDARIVWKRSEKASHHHDNNIISPVASSSIVATVKKDRDCGADIQQQHVLEC